MPFLYETHMHTCQGSACGRATGKEQARVYKEAGFTGIIITDHFFGGNTAVDRSLPWEERVDLFWKGYEDAKEEGDRIGLDVFFGLEQNIHFDEYLIYGLTKEYMKAHPEMEHWTRREQLEEVHMTTRYEQIGGVYLERLYPTDIFDLIDYSLQRCLEKELRFRVCKNCGRYFAISRSAKAEYCDTFPDENGRTCRNVGAITAWTKKRESDDVFMTYRREYKKRFARIRSGTLLPEDFYRWSEQARQKKDELEAGEIDVDTFLSWLANS